MSVAYQLETTTTLSYSPLAERLAIAQQRIERSFLEGGSVLIAVMEAVSGLTKSLDSLTSLFDPQSTLKVLDGMTQAVGGLADLPAAADSKQVAFTSIAVLCDSVYKNVEDMREIIRYLRTIAITVKITGASIPEFSGFADEIRERIQSVSEEVDRFAGQLSAMRGRLADATKSSDGVIRDFSATIPLLVANLDQGSIALTDQQRRMSETANELKTITGSIQMKIGTILSALQIGDITRQRIEHVMTSLEYYQEFMASDEILSIDGTQLACLEKAIKALAKAQLEESVAEFHQQCSSIAGTIASFTADASQVMSLRDELAGGKPGVEGNILTQMQMDLSHAAELSHQVLDRTHDLDAVVSSVDKSTLALINGIAAIRRIKLDIFYMALNSNLACTKLGEGGRAVNVVSGELRVFADRLEGPAEDMVLTMKEIETAKATLTATAVASGNGDPLSEARLAIDAAAQAMSVGLASLSREGESVFGSIERAIRTLDFRSDLGDVLDDCLAMAASNDNSSDALVGEENAAINGLSSRIFSIYTMAQEREIHRLFLPMSCAAAGPEVEIGSSDDDLFGELF